MNQYARVTKMPQSTLDELNFRLQTLSESDDDEEDGARALSPKGKPQFGSDINPSVGDISDKESDLNIRQLESSVSSLSGITYGSSFSPQENPRRRPTVTDF